MESFPELVAVGVKRRVHKKKRLPGKLDLWKNLIQSKQEIKQITSKPFQSYLGDQHALNLAF